MNGSVARSGPRPIPNRCRTCYFVLGLALLAGVVWAAEAAQLPLRADPARLAAAPTELRARLLQDPLIYFRFVNAQWASRVCTAFSGDLDSFPPAILHGDAHIEQYALTSTARGLDDFDDASHGPSVIDSVRFLGSVEIVARLRGWTGEREGLFRTFFEGYARALADPGYLPPDPAVVKRLRSRPARTRDEFLAWAESLMQPLTAPQADFLTSSLELLESVLRSMRPDLPRGYLHPKKSGALTTGVGSALTRKFLVRAEGSTTSPHDDVLIEAKELSRLDMVPCLQVPISGEALRVIDAAKQIGRIRHDILVKLPRREYNTSDTRDWWVRSWDETYREVTVADLASADELGELVHDAGAQLGATNLRASIPALERKMRQAELAAVRRLEPKIRALALQLVDALYAGWEELRASASPGGR